MVDWTAHYDAIYESIAVDAELFIDSEPVSVRVIDKTSGIVIEPGVQLRQATVGVATIKPACVIRTHELAELGISRSSLRRSEVTFNGGSWRIENFLERPSPIGLAVGELMLILTEAPSGSA